MDTKQVIVMRKDLNMRKGKIAAQAAHASLGAILQLCDVEGWSTGAHRHTLDLAPEDPVNLWLEGSFRKICVYVESEIDLLFVEGNARAAGLNVCLITDNGLTEFGGVPTRTCLAIGPDFDDKIDVITGKLKLY